LVVEENHSYSESNRQFLHALLQQPGLAVRLGTQYFADAHPSIPNYLMLTTGQTETFDDNFSGTIAMTT